MSKIMPIDEEYVYEGSVIISQTDLKGLIVYANKQFCETSGYTLAELIGKPHSIIRHPDMPTATFTKMWETIVSGQVWNGLVKNLRKDGLYYWVGAEILPLRDEEQNIVGYIAARKPVNKKNVMAVEEIYSRMLEQEK